MAPADLLEGLLAGLVAGALLAYLIVRHSSATGAAEAMTIWRARQGRSLARQAVETSRWETKALIDAKLDSTVRGMGYDAADVRFLGHPAHLVVFDGHDEVRAREAEEVRSVIFVSAVAAPGQAAGRSDVEMLDEAILSDLRLIEECLDSGRVRWETYRAEF